jgi:hypothetical protein
MDKSADDQVSEQTLLFDLDPIMDVAHVGIRRALFFMGLGINAANRSDFRDYQLSKIPTARIQRYKFFSDDLPNERIDEVKQEFAQWITGNGLREIQEHLAMFLDQFHRFILLVRQTKGAIDEEVAEKSQREFERFGVPNKIDMLQKRFAIELEYAKEVASLYEARNCLTHDLGIVSQRRLNEGDKFKVRWRAINAIGKGEATGRSYQIEELAGKPTEEPIQISISIAEKEVAFSINEKMHL